MLQTNVANMFIQKGWKYQQLLQNVQVARVLIGQGLAFRGSNDRWREVSNDFYSGISGVGNFMARGVKFT